MIDSTGILTFRSGSSLVWNGHFAQSNQLCWLLIEGQTGYPHNLLKFLLPNNFFHLTFLVLDNLYDCICQMAIFRFNFLFVSVLMAIIYSQINKNFYIDIDCICIDHPFCWVKGNVLLLSKDCWPHAWLQTEILCFPFSFSCGGNFSLPTFLNHYLISWVLLVSMGFLGYWWCHGN